MGGQFVIWNIENQIVNKQKIVIGGKGEYIVFIIEKIVGYNKEKKMRKLGDRKEFLEIGNTIVEINLVESLEDKF